MNRIILPLVALLCVFFTQISLAQTPTAPDSKQQLGQQGLVLGQPSQMDMAKLQAEQARILKEQALAAEREALFEKSLEHMMPLSEEQIQQYRIHSDERERALLPVIPSLKSRTVRVNLESGSKPIRVHTTANVSTSLVFHDSTGAPWAITSVTNGSPAYFQVLRPQLPEGNLLNITPTQNYGVSTINITLEKQDVPLVIMLMADSVRSPQRQADALVLFQIAGHGPNAHTPIIESMRETVTSPMLAFLDQVPPEKSKRIPTNPPDDKLKAWKFNNTLYLRTQYMLMWPAWSAVVNGAGNVKCYELPITSRILVSKNGKVQTILLKDALLQGK